MRIGMIETVFMYGNCCIGTRNVYRETLKSLLSEPGNLVVLIVGGTAESLEGDPGHYSLVLKKRKGFVREAIRNG